MPQILLDQKKNRQGSDAPSIFAGFAPDFSGNKIIAEVRSCSELGLSV